MSADLAQALLAWAACIAPLLLAAAVVGWQERRGRRIRSSRPRRAHGTAVAPSARHLSFDSTPTRFS